MKEYRMPDKTIRQVYDVADDETWRDVVAVEEHRHGDGRELSLMSRVNHRVLSADEVCNRVESVGGVLIENGE